MKLSDLKTGQSGVIVKILGHGAFRKRVMEMGFVRGRRITVELDAPLKDPIKYSIMGYEVSLRRAEAALIEVVPFEEGTEMPEIALRHGELSGDESDTVFNKQNSASHIINVALVGNPNCGKT